MKKLLILFAVVSLTVMNYSCSKDDSVSSDKIVGKWQFYKTGSVYQGVENLLPYQHLCDSKKDYIEFLGNGSIKSITHGSDCEADVDEGRWERQGNVLKLSGFDAATVSYDILTIDGSTLKVKAPEVSGYSGVMEFKKM